MHFQTASQTGVTAPSPADRFSPADVPLPADDVPKELDGHKFTLSHPKNYLGVPTAVADPSDEAVLIPEYLVKLPRDAVAGATALGLLTEDRTLTARGARVAARAEGLADGNESPLALLSELRGSRKRLADVAPEWAALGQRVFSAHLPTQAITAVLSSHGSLTLPQLVTALATEAPELVKSWFAADHIDTTTVDAAVSRAAQSPISDPPVYLSRPDWYASHAVSHLKSLLYHVGILTAAGTDTSNLDPASQEWALEDSLLETPHAAADTGGRR